MDAADIDGITLEYEASGGGEPVLLIHGALIADAFRPLLAGPGLGDPLIANRMLLWGLGTGAVAGVAAVHFVTQLQGIHALPPQLVGVVSLLVLVTACAQWLAFFPPRGYVRRFAAPSG